MDLNNLRQVASVSRMMVELPGSTRYQGWEMDAVIFMHRLQERYVIPMHIEIESLHGWLEDNLQQTVIKLQLAIAKEGSMIEA